MRTDQIAGIAASLDCYMIKIAGCSSGSGSRRLDQELNGERAAAIANYLGLRILKGTSSSQWSWSMHRHR